ncbi:MAG: DUF4912 domain-containing protein [Candidatus Omnitrophota bacterium]
MAQGSSKPLNTRARKSFKFPQGYGDHKIVLLVRDPWWLFTYWEVRKDKEEEIVRKIKDAGEMPDKSILRVYDVTDINFNGRNARSFFDIELKGLASTWYINVNMPDSSWVVDIGIVSNKGKFYLLSRSNIVRTPRFGMSDQLDTEWMAPEESFRKMFALSGGMGVGKGSLEVREMFKKRLEEQVTSGGISSSASFYRRPAERKFWLVVNCELIVYGATEPDAKLTVQGKDIKLREDGTFTLRFALPDGKQEIPVEATSSDGIDRRRITPIVTRKTE